MIRVWRIVIYATKCEREKKLDLIRSSLTAKPPPLI